MKVGIIGAGASGLMAAYTAAKKGHKVTLLEHTGRAGRKLLATGGGKCNLSNEDMSLSHFHGDEDFIKAVLGAVSREDVFDILGEMGLLIGVRNGYYYPYSEQAKEVLKVLNLACRRQKVNLILDCNVLNISYFANGAAGSPSFNVSTDLGEYIFDKLIIAAGSKASSKTGSDGSGYDIASMLGHKIITPLPALCALRCEGNFWKKLKGIRCRADISLSVDGEVLGSDSGELQLTDYGLSGIPAMQLSYLASKALNMNKRPVAHVNFLKGYDKVRAKEFIEQRLKAFSCDAISDALTGIVHEGILAVLLDKCSLAISRSAGSISKKEIDCLIDAICNFSVRVNAANSFEEAQICCGGVDTGEVNYNLESKLKKGLFFAGEILDVNGDCGGYNLQWAFSTGALSGGYKDA